MKKSLLFCCAAILISCETATSVDEKKVVEVISPEATPQEGFTFDHYAVIVKDLERASKFYLDVMGLEEIYDATEKDHIRWFSLGPHLALHVIESPEVADVRIGKSVHLALTRPDFKNFVAGLRASEYPFENWAGQPDTTNLRPDGVAQVYFQDPDGYWIEVNDAVRF